MLVQVTPLLTVMFKLFFLPFLVVIIITPLAARDPYSAVAAAPFSTLTDSMLSGFKSAAALPKSVPTLPVDRLAVLLLALLTGTPSMTKSAWLLPVIEEYPRIITLVEPPMVLLLLMSSPATFPDKASTKLGVRVLVIWSP